VKAYPCLACDLVMLRGAPAADPPAQCPSCGVDGRGAALAVDEAWRKDVAVPALAALLSDADGGLRHRAAKALARIGEEARAAVPQLVEAIAADRELRSLAMRALHAIGAEAEPALPVLLRVVRDWADPDRDMARRAVVAIATPALRVRPTVEARRRCAWALAQVGVAARESAATLLLAMRDDVLPVRRASAWALTRVRPEAEIVLAGLIEAATRDEDAAVRRMALHGIGQLGRNGVEAAKPVAIVLKKDADIAARRRAVAVIERVGAEADVLVPALVAALGDEDAKVRRLAAAALGRQGRAAKAGVPLLVKAIFRDAARSVRRRAARALGSVDPDAKTAVSGLIEALVS
jgi:HEAT repeat protein